MSYYASIKANKLHIDDPDGLLNHINNMSHKDDSSLEEAFPKFTNISIVEIDKNGYAFLYAQGVMHSEKVWDEIAPFVTGYVEWIDENDTLFRDTFYDGIYIKEHPDIIWPSEWFYHEKWCDEDIKAQIREFDISEEDPLFEQIFCEAYDRVIDAFDDKSYRNEQIEQIISQILYEHER